MAGRQPAIWWRLFALLAHVPPRRVHPALLILFPLPSPLSLLPACLCAPLNHPRQQSPETAEVLEALRGCQEQARRRHVGMYVYGDPGSDEEADDGGFPALGKPGGGRGGRR